MKSLIKCKVVCLRREKRDKVRSVRIAELFCPTRSKRRSR